MPTNKNTVWTTGTPIVAGPINMAIVGHCPHCGAPVWGPINWMGELPPAVYHACECRHLSAAMGRPTIVETEDEARHRRAMEMQKCLHMYS